MLSESDALFNNVNSSLYSYLMHQCSGDNNPDPRSPCDPPSSDDACEQTGFPMADAIAACASLQSSPNAYDACIYDCCITAVRAIHAAQTRDAHACARLRTGVAHRVHTFSQSIVQPNGFCTICSMLAVASAVPQDTEFCKGLAEESDEETQDFEKELIDDGRLVNIDDHSEYCELSTVPSLRALRAPRRTNPRPSPRSHGP